MTATITAPPDRPGLDDTAESWPVGCTIRLTSDGTVTVRRDPGCTPNDVRDLCAAVARDEVEVIDLTA
jgi:hypothetical protein